MNDKSLCAIFGTGVRWSSLEMGRQMRVRSLKWQIFAYFTRHCRHVVMHKIF